MCTFFLAYLTCGAFTILSDVALVCSMIVYRNRFTHVHDFCPVVLFIVNSDTLYLRYLTCGMIHCKFRDTVPT